jgi:hypothetical protein
MAGYTELFTSPRARAYTVALAAVLFALMSLLGANVAEAQDSGVSGTLPPGDTLDYSSLAANPWGLEGLEHGSNNLNYDSYVFAMIQRGNRLYVGGKFLEVTNGSTTRSQPFLAAFNATTGNHIASFQPDIEWPVFALAVSPDNSRLFVGGEFDDAGAPGTAAFAALDPISGAVDPTFDLEVSRPWSTLRPRIHAIEIVGNDMYLGGAFSRVSQGGTLVNTKNVARVSVLDGTPDTSFDPDVDGGAVWALEGSPDGSRLYMGGLFDIVNGGTVEAFATVNTSDGLLTPGLPLDLEEYFDSGFKTFVSSIQAVGDRVVIGGQDHKTLITEADDLNVLREWHTNQYNAEAGRGGDTQDITVAGDVIFVGCHCWGQVHEIGTDYFVDVESVYALDLTTGDHLTSFAPDLNGISGPWALHVAPDQCLWTGGDYLQAGGTAARNLVRLCANGATDPKPVTACTVADLGGGSVQVDWTRAANDNADRYVIHRSRNGGTFSWAGMVPSPGSGYTNNNVQPDSYAYRVTTMKGNEASAAVDCSPSPIDVGADDGPVAVVSCTVADAGSGEVHVSWDAAANDNADAYVVHRSRNGGPLSWAGRITAPATSFTNTGVQPDTYSYTVTTRLGSAAADAVSCSPADLVVGAPSLPVAVVSCAATQVDGSSIDISWVPAANDNAERYIVYRSRNAGVASWAGAVTAPGTTFANSNIRTGTYTYEVAVRSGSALSARVPCSPAGGIVL